MSDLRDLINARSEAEANRRNAMSYGSQIEDGREGDPALAILLAAEAICSQLHAMATLYDYWKSGE